MLSIYSAFILDFLVGDPYWLPEGFNDLTRYHFRLAVKDSLSNDMLLKALIEIMGEK